MINVRDWPWGWVAFGAGLLLVSVGVAGEWAVGAVLSALWLVGNLFAAVAG